jgi:hypothetical protein
VLYRIFRRSLGETTYKLQEPSDIEVEGRWEAAAVEWARRYAPKGVDELDLMVTRFISSKIGEMQRVRLRRNLNPWVIVQQATWSDDAG